MSIEKFIQDGKLIVPEEEIDNIYIWSRVTKTQEVLLSSKVYYDWANNAFNNEVKRVVSTLKVKLPAISEDTYKFADFITFTANKSLIFNDATCFVYSTNQLVLDSLACYLAHTKNKFLPESDSLASLIINKIEEHEKFTAFMDKDFIILNIYAALPEHKYRSAILDALLTRRSRPGLCTLIHTINSGLLIGQNLISEDYAKRYNLVNVDLLAKKLSLRRAASYQAIMKQWFELMTVNIDDFVYSKTQPQQHFRKIDRYK